MTVKQLEEMDFFELKLLAEKKGTFYVREGEVFIYHGTDKLKMSSKQPSAIDPSTLPSKVEKDKPETNPDDMLIGNKVGTQLDVTKDIKCDGVFWFWQHEEYFVLCFITDTSKTHKGTVYMLRAGNATDSL